MSTCKQLVLETLGSQPIMPKYLSPPDTASDLGLGTAIFSSMHGLPFLTHAHGIEWKGSNLMHRSLVATPAVWGLAWKWIPLTYRRFSLHEIPFLDTSALLHAAGREACRWPTNWPTDQLAHSLSLLGTWHDTRDMTSPTHFILP